VNVFNPVRGVFGPVESRGVSPTAIDTLGIFAEDSLRLTDRITFMAGLRYERLDLLRQNFDLRPGQAGQDEGTGFTRTFKNVGFRIGGTYAVSPRTNLYAQYSNAQDPANANIFLIDANEDFELTDAEQFEIGLKAQDVGGIANLDFTAAVFHIERDDVSQVIARDSAVNVGGRESRGVELAFSFAPSTALDLGANFSYVDAEFKDSVNFITFSGNTPPNVPEVTANAWVNHRPLRGIPLTLGASLRHVGERFGTNDNTIRLNDYTLLGLSARYAWRNMSVTARLNNVTDEDYVEWADVFYLAQPDFANQVFLGAPRNGEIILEFRF
jgi:iron complex outermembrane receptor protein